MLEAMAASRSTTAGRALPMGGEAEGGR